jgi:hypothetical protein
MNIFALKGHKVKCVTLTAGYDFDQEIAKKYLVVGEVYTIEKTEVFNARTNVWLQEIPNVKFNSVLFADVIEQMKQDDIRHLDYYRFNK